MGQRRAQLHGEVVERLGRVRGALSDDEFAALVDRVVEVQLRYERSATPTMVERAALARAEQRPGPA